MAFVIDAINDTLRKPVEGWIEGGNNMANKNNNKRNKRSNNRRNPDQLNKKLFYYSLILGMGHLPNRLASLKALRQSILDLMVQQGDTLNVDPEFPDSFWSVLIPIARARGMKDKHIKQLVLRIRKAEEAGSRSGIIEELDQDEGLFNNLGDIVTGIFDDDPDTTFLGGVGDLFSDLFS